MMPRALPVLLLAVSSATSLAQLFSDEERARVVAYWNEPGRYAVSAPPDAARKGPYQVRMSVEGSQWLWNYDRARGLTKGPPTANSPDLTPEQKEWGAWIDARFAYDRWLAQRAAAEANARAAGASSAVDKATPLPGLAPAGLIRLVGNPPPFASVVAPLQHTIRFDERTSLNYVDNPLQRPRYAYYRFPQGVMSAGARVREMPASFLDGLFGEAGISASERKVMAAVSLLEGGFDSVNTYDTGYVSVGFIQFACLREGGGSLGQVLLRQKQDAPASFEADFRAFGLDVAPNGALVCLDPSTGVELTGLPAAMEIIEDKRLIAVFQRAGLLSHPFRLAQVKVARALYYPGTDVVSIQVGGRLLSGTVSSFIRSEAGMATLMDRKVNTGKLEPLPTVLALIAGENNLQKFEDFARFERDIVAAMRFRKNYLEDPTLSQPGPSRRPDRNYGALLD
jgi:hypothetical protein